VTSRKSPWRKLPTFVRKHQLACFGQRKDPETYAAEHEFTEDVDQAHVITSIAGGGRDAHRPVLDIDFPAAVIASSTPGHFHLYLDKEMPWDTYQELLRALEAAGLVEPGYVGASIERQYTSVRLPWIRKQEVAPL
jgi:hypothetical protein